MEEHCALCPSFLFYYTPSESEPSSQDDDQDKKNQIEAMNSIFSSAQIVLIAAYRDGMGWILESLVSTGALPSTIKESELPLLTITHATKVRPGGVIATKCQAAFLHLSPRPSYSSNIINEDGERIGELCGDTARLRREQGLWLLRLAMAHHRTSRSNSLPFHCLASGSCLIGPKNYYDVNGNALAKVPIVNVLMITRDGDFARRRELWLGMLG
ncbi:hypothetical protein GX48_07960 [Paracoccidioides brasiliensis]|nr:hypothetical protein GX48_07960 [Paracoccidioides brasiliensis]